MELLEWENTYYKYENIRLIQFRSFALVASRQILDWANSRRDETA